MYEIAIALTFLFASNSQHNNLAKVEEYEKAIAIGKLCQQKDMSFFYWEAIAQFQLGHKKECVAAIKNILSPLENNQATPERYTEMCHLMVATMETWKDKPLELDNISRDMKSVSRRLKLGYADKNTQDIQKDILARLDKIIEDAESQTNSPSMAQSQGGDSRKINPDTPIDMDRIANGPGGKGKIDEKALMKSREGWGKLPPKERAQAIEAIARQYPAHYRESIEGYLKNLSKAKDSVNK